MQKFCVNKSWKDEDKQVLSKALKTFGKNYYKLRKALPSKTMHQIHHYTNQLVYKIQRNKNHEDADLLKILSKPAIKVWTSADNK